MIDFMKRPPHILVTGSHRSGTTWVGRTISQHQYVKYISEPFNPKKSNNDLGLKVTNWFIHAPSSNYKNDIEDAFNNLLKLSPFQLSIQKSSLKRDFKMPLRFCKRLALNIFRRNGILIKDPIALLSAGWLHEKYDLKVICMIRNPLSFIGSIKKAGWNYYFYDFLKQKRLLETWLAPFKSEVERLAAKPSDIIDHGCLLWNIFHYVILDYQKHYPSWKFLKYEDIAMNPLLEFEELFDLLGLQMDGKIKSYIGEYTSDRNPNDRYSTGYRPRNSKACLTNWKSRLTSKEISRVKSATHKISHKFYDDSLFNE
jgi:hypothetical protein